MLKMLGKLVFVGLLASFSVGIMGPGAQAVPDNDIIDTWGGVGNGGGGCKIINYKLVNHQCFEF